MVSQLSKAVASMVMNLLPEHGLELAGRNAGGHTLVILVKPSERPTGNQFPGDGSVGLDGASKAQLTRQLMFRDVPPATDALEQAVSEFVAEISRRHGPGRIWGVNGLDPVHLLFDDGVGVRRLRAIYFHENATVEATT